MTDLSPLIERLSAATGPDRELDAEISAHLHGGIPSHQAEQAWKRSYSAGYVHRAVPGGGFHAPHYTGSIDAAVRLVPEGEKYRPHKVILAVSQSGTRFSTVLDSWQWGKIVGHGSNYAIALCIAALKARAAR